MTDEQALINIVGSVFLPWLLAVIMQRTWSDALRTIVAAASYLIVTLLSAVFLNPIDLTDQGWRQVVLTFATILIPAYYSFKLVWRPTGVTDKIEAATSPGPA